MGKLTYAEQLRHPNWQRKRLEMLQAANFECASCGTGEMTLHVHHKQYRKGRMAWEYGNGDLVVLCEGCHATEHELRDQLSDILKEIPVVEVVGLLAGFVGLQSPALAKQVESAKSTSPLAFNAGMLAALAYSLGIGQIQDLQDQAHAVLQSNLTSGKIRGMDV